MSLSQPARAVGIGLLGCGTVGGGVAHLLTANPAAIARVAGADFVLRGVAVRDLHKPRNVTLPLSLLTNDPNTLVDDPHVDLIVECIGGVGIARTLVERALERGKHVVTANKDLLATEGPRLAALAAARGVTLHYEAAVGGAIPIVRALTDSLAGEDVLEVGGVLNGTTNFILSAMGTGSSYAGALAEAQRLGFAEADPTSDVEGIDAGHKLAILAQLSFKHAVTSNQIARRGITSVSRDDVVLASRLGMRVKLIACARSNATGIRASVTPAYVRIGHPFAEPTGAHNCIRVIGRSSGSLTFAGSGAGRDPTASAVIGDVIAALRRLASGGSGALKLTPIDAPLAPISLPHIVRLQSLRDVRPAVTALGHAGIIAHAAAHVPAVVTAAFGLDRDPEVAAALATDGLRAASMHPLWEDESHEATDESAAQTDALAV